MTVFVIRPLVEFCCKLSSFTYIKIERICLVCSLTVFSDIDSYCNRLFSSDTQSESDVKDQFELLFEIPGVTISRFYEYRFLMLDFVYITRNHALIRKHYQKLMQEREIQFKSLVNYLVAAKLMREELIDNEYRYLFKNLRSVSDFWLSAATIDRNTPLNKKDILEGSRLLKQMIFPYLTTKGRSVFLESNRED